MEAVSHAKCVDLAVSMTPLQRIGERPTALLRVDQIVKNFKLILRDSWTNFNALWFLKKP